MDTHSPLELVTFSLLEKERNPSSVFYPAKVSSYPSLKKEKKDLDTKNEGLITNYSAYEVIISLDELKINL